MDTTYTACVAAMRRHCESLVTALQRASGLRWQRWSDPATGLSRADVIKPFSREGTGKTYVDELNKGLDGKVGRSMAAKMQGDVLSSIQQGLVFRHMSRLQCTGAVLSRAKSHAQYDIDRLFVKQISNLESV